MLSLTKLFVKRLNQKQIFVLFVPMRFYLSYVFLRLSIVSVGFALFLSFLFVDPCALRCFYLFFFAFPLFSLLFSVFIGFLWFSAFSFFFVVLLQKNIVEDASSRSCRIYSFPCFCAVCYEELAQIASSPSCCIFGWIWDTYFHFPLS